MHGGEGQDHAFLFWNSSCIQAYVQTLVQITHGKLVYIEVFAHVHCPTRLFISPLNHQDRYNVIKVPSKLCPTVTTEKLSLTTVEWQVHGNLPDLWGGQQQRKHACEWLLISSVCRLASAEGPKQVSRAVVVEPRRRGGPADIRVQGQGGLCTW